MSFLTETPEPVTLEEQIQQAIDLLKNGNQGDSMAVLVDMRSRTLGDLYDPPKTQRRDQWIVY